MKLSGIWKMKFTYCLFKHYDAFFGLVEDAVDLNVKILEVVKVEGEVHHRVVFENCEHHENKEKDQGL